MIVTLLDGSKVPMPRAYRPTRQPMQTDRDPLLIACGLTTLDELRVDDERAAYARLQAADLELKRTRHRASSRRRR